MDGLVWEKEKDKEERERVGTSPAGSVILAGWKTRLLCDCMTGA
jgi:hypothetical protein